MTRANRFSEPRIAPARRLAKVRDPSSSLTASLGAERQTSRRCWHAPLPSDGHWWRSARQGLFLDGCTDLVGLHLCCDPQGAGCRQMREIRTSLQDDYALWYLGRELAKSHPEPILSDPAVAIQTMRVRHAGKWRDWFGDARWSVASLDLSDMRNLVFLESPWTKDEGLVVRDGADYRLLKRVAQRAININYLSRSSTGRHLSYYERIKGGFRLTGEERMAICSAEPSEMASNPSARFYLLDGAGRGLAYAILLAERRLPYEPVEAFVAERRT